MAGIVRRVSKVVRTVPLCGPLCYGYGESLLCVREHRSHADFDAPFLVDTGLGIEVAAGEGELFHQRNTNEDYCSFVN